MEGLYVLPLHQGSSFACARLLPLQDVQWVRGLVVVRVSWPGHHELPKKKNNKKKNYCQKPTIKQRALNTLPKAASTSHKQVQISYLTIKIIAQSESTCESSNTPRAQHLISYTALAFYQPKQTAEQPFHYWNPQLKVLMHYSTWPISFNIQETIEKTIISRKIYIEYNHYKKL